jgi:hypothetical protein
MTWMRRSAFIAVVAGASLFAGSTPVGASAPVGECPTAKWVLRASPSAGSGAVSVDVNGNGLSCWLEEPEGSGLFTVIDDIARSPHA